MDRFKHLWMVESFVSNVRAVFAYAICPVSAFLANASLPWLDSSIEARHLKPPVANHRDTWYDIYAVYYEMNRARCTNESRDKDSRCVLDIMHDPKTLRVPSTLGCLLRAANLVESPRGSTTNGISRFTSAVVSQRRQIYTYIYNIYIYIYIYKYISLFL